MQAVHVLIYLRCDTFGGPKGCGNSQPKHDITTQEKVHNTSSTPGLGRAGNPILFAVIKYLKITNKVCYETLARTRITDIHCLYQGWLVAHVLFSSCLAALSAAFIPPG